MALTLDDITTLFSSEYVGLQDDFKIFASATQNDCHNYVLSGSSECGDISPLSIYMEIPSFEPLTHARTRRGIKLGDESEYFTWQKLSPVITFQVITTADIQNKIELLNLHRVKTFTNIATSAVVNVLDIEVQATEEDQAVKLQIRILCKDADKVVSICCGSFYEDAPYNECDGGGETGDPNNDPTCAGFSVEIQLNTDPVDTLFAALTGEPDNGGQLVYTWYRGKVQIASGTFPTIQPDQPGLYTVHVSKGNCQVEAEFLYSGECGGYEVDIEQITLADGSIVLVAKPQRVSTLQWQVDTGSGFEDIAGATGIVYYPLVDGVYRVQGDSSGCMDDSNELNVDVQVTCAGLFGITMEVVDGIVQSTITGYAGAGTPAYTWFVDTGSGLVEIPDESDSWYEPTTTGYYQVQIVLDGCTKTAGILYVNDCVSFKAYISKLIENGGDIEMTAASRNAPDSVNYSWYTREGDKWELQFSGTPFTLTEKKAVRLVATSGACTKTEELYFCADPASITPYEKFLGSVAQETVFEVTAFTVPQGVDQGGSLTANDINARYDVFRNGKKLYYVPLADLSTTSQDDINAYSFNYSDNELTLPDNQQAFDGDVFEVRDNG